MTLGEGSVCVICAGAALLMLAQICGVPLPSNWVQAKACGGAEAGGLVDEEGAPCAPVAVGVVPWPRAVDALLLQPASSASDASSASTASSQGMRDELRIDEAFLVPAAQTRLARQRGGADRVGGTVYRLVYQERASETVAQGTSLLRASSHFGAPLRAGEGPGRGSVP